MTDERRRDAAIVSVRVNASASLAFEVFTSQIDQWWRRGLRYRTAGAQRGFVRLEPGLGGRLYEEFETDLGPRRVETGVVTEWNPPHRLAYEWRGVNFDPDQKTLVEVSFEPRGQGTMVTVRHSGWASIPDTAPVRHGQDDAAFIRGMGLWWGDLMTSLREHIAETSDR